MTWPDLNWACQPYNGSKPRYQHNPPRASPEDGTVNPCGRPRYRSDGGSKNALATNPSSRSSNPSARVLVRCLVLHSRKCDDQCRRDFQARHFSQSTEKRALKMMNKAVRGIKGQREGITEICRIMPLCNIAPKATAPSTQLWHATESRSWFLHQRYRIMCLDSGGKQW